MYHIFKTPLQKIYISLDAFLLDAGLYITTFLKDFLEFLFLLITFLIIKDRFNIKILFKKILF